MLVLTRKANESIRIGEDVIVTVSRITGRRVSLSISAPEEISILRSEISLQQLAVNASSQETAIPAAAPLAETGLGQAG